ncbi:hypothetical protein ACLOJK_009433 [Asimina triloba]
MDLRGRARKLELSVGYYRWRYGEIQRGQSFQNQGKRQSGLESTENFPATTATAPIVTRATTSHASSYMLLRTNPPSVDSTAQIKVVIFVLTSIN